MSSFGADSAVMLHMIAEIDRTMPVIFLETGKHFAETLGYRDALVADFGLTDIRISSPTKPRSSGSIRPATSTRPTPTPAAISARSSRWRAASSRFAPG